MMEDTGQRVVWKGTKRNHCDAATLDEDGVAYLGTQWAATNLPCYNENLEDTSICNTWGSYIMKVQQS
jgi:hypothetical protein